MTTTQDDTVTEEVAPASRRPLRPVVTTFVVATALSLAMGAVWAISTPLFASPDEPSHAIRAVATWTGDPSGEVTRNAGIKVKEYRVPSPYDQSQAIAACSAFDATKTADCGPPFDPDGRTQTAMSTAGFYPPLFYWAVGWGGAVIDGSAGLYLMRFIHVALCAVLIGLAAVCTVRRGRRGLPLVGVALAVTPMVMFLAGTVNSSGLEIAASIALWASLLALLGEEGPPSFRRWPDAVIAVCSGLVLVFTRTFSPGYAAVICAIAFAASPGVNLRNIWRRRDALATFGILAVASVVATLLIIRSGQFDSPATGGASLPPGETPLSIGLGFQELAFRQMIAYFGWLDTGTAQLTYYSWIIVCGTLVVAALVVGRWRRILGLTLAVLATVVLPIAANWGQAKTDGFVWQGRYSLPLAVGIPLISALACGESGLLERMARRLVVMLAGLAAIGQTYAVYWALRRHSVGLDGELVYFGLADWSPPVLGTAGTMAAALAISVALVVALTRAGPALPQPAGLDTTDDPAPSTEAGIP